MEKQKKVYLHTPKNKEKLKKAIKIELKKQGNEANLNCIDTSKITDMSYVFYNIRNSDNDGKYKFRDLVENFKGDVSEWNTSKVTNMVSLFHSCCNYNGDISNWDMTNVETTSKMFYFCEKFEGKGIEKLNMSNVRDMSYMFYRCKYFNKNLSGWNVSKVKDMREMFSFCYDFNGDLSGWDTIDVENMEKMFGYCTKFKGKGLENWNISNVSEMNRMFYKCVNLSENLSKWDLSNKDIDNIFEGTRYKLKVSVQM